MKKHFTQTVLLLLFVFPFYSNAQSWCEPAVLPYSAAMPGITNFTLNDINRTSADLENINNNYVNTGLTTTLQQGQTYNISMTFTIDGSISPHMNLRVWLDYNLDHTFEDPGEELLTVDHLAAGTFQGSFTVPTSSIIGTTRLRATAKMCSHGGHTLPTPCNIPADPLGYHGEIEDYGIILEAGTGITLPVNLLSSVSVFPNPASENAVVDFTLNTQSDVVMVLTDVSGRMIWQSEEAMLSAGRHSMTINVEELSAGLYTLRILNGKVSASTPIAIVIN